MIFQFKGLMAPVFTSFNDDKRRSVNYDNIDAYASYLKDNQVLGVLVNGTSGEGMSLNVSERKLLTEHWYQACKKYQLTLMVQIGGCPFVDVVELAEHANKLGVDAILCLPELYFRPKTEQDLVNYFREISAHCAATPLLYYHIPAFTGVNLNMPTFLDLAEATVSNFVGLKYTSGDLDQGSACLKPGRSVFLGADTLLCAALALGFDSAIMTTLSICPKLSIEILQAMKSGNLAEAQKSQQLLTENVNRILKHNSLVCGEWVPAMKLEFNESDNFLLYAGPTRHPLKWKL